MDLVFPIVRRVQAQTIADSIQPVMPVTYDEVVKGRRVEQVKHNYYDFTSSVALMIFIMQKVKESGWKLSDLRVAKHHSIKLLNNDPDVFYDDRIGCLEVTALHFIDQLDDMPTGGTVVSLDPRKWTVESIEEIIKEIQNAK